MKKMLSKESELECMSCLMDHACLCSGIAQAGITSMLDAIKRKDLTDFSSLVEEVIGECNTLKCYLETMLTLSISCLH